MLLSKYRSTSDGTIKYVQYVFVLFYITTLTSPASSESKRITNPTTAGGLQDSHLSWTTWSECSQGCGVGISFSEAHCAGDPSSCFTNDIFQRRRYKVCLKENCGQYEGNLRYSQCSAFNDIPYKGSVHRWEPVPLQQILTSESHQICAVNCRDRRNASLIVALAPQALDGTSCSGDSNRMCINGKCETIGCDRILNSEKKDDVCGICDGNGSKCRLFTGLYLSTRNQMQEKPHWFAIPQGSANIEITEKGSGHIHLGYITDSPKKSLFEWGMTNNQHYGILEIGGIKIEFSSPPSGKWLIRIKSRIPHAINVTIIEDAFPLTYIRYEYYKPLKYAWSHDEGKCSVKCGKGLLFNQPACLDIEVDELTNEIHCRDEGLSKPSPTFATCNVINCRISEVDSLEPQRLNLTFEWMRWYSWQTTPWTICSKSCEGGIQSRDVYCGTEEMNGKIRRIDDERRCLRKEERPIKQQKCNEVPCPLWVSSFWHACSVSCGEGVRYRTVRCENGLGGPAFNCDEKDKPNVSQTCSNPCPTYNEEPRMIRFKNDMKPVPIPIRPILPDVHPIPLQEEPRQTMLAANVQETVFQLSTDPSWVPGPWGDCSKTCGLGGVTTREMKCRMMLTFANRIETIPEDQCSHLPRPMSSKACSMGPCTGEMTAKLIPVDDDIESPIFIQTESTDDSMNSQGFAAAYRYRMEAVVQATSNPQTGIGEELDAVEDEPMYHEYKWKYTAFEPCTPSCGFGTSRKLQLCIHVASQVRVADDRCDPDTKKVPIVQKCNDGSCFLPMQSYKNKTTRPQYVYSGVKLNERGTGYHQKHLLLKDVPIYTQPFISIINELVSRNLSYRTNFQIP